MIEIDKVFLKRHIAVHIVRIIAVRASSRTIEATAAIELTIIKIKKAKKIRVYKYTLADKSLFIDCTLSF